MTAPPAKGARDATLDSAIPRRAEVRRDRSWLAAAPGAADGLSLPGHLPVSPAGGAVTDWRRDFGWRRYRPGAFGYSGDCSRCGAAKPTAPERHGWWFRRLPRKPHRAGVLTEARCAACGPDTNEAIHVKAAGRRGGRRG
jgi:hypothetical protein